MPRKRCSRRRADHINRDDERSQDRCSDSGFKAPLAHDEYATTHEEKLKSNVLGPKPPNADATADADQSPDGTTAARAKMSDDIDFAT